MLRCLLHVIKISMRKTFCSFGGRDNAWLSFSESRYVIREREIPGATEILLCKKNRDRSLTLGRGRDWSVTSRKSTAATGAFRGLSKACNRCIEAIRDAMHCRDARVSFAIANRARFDKKKLCAESYASTPSISTLAFLRL